MLTTKEKMRQASALIRNQQYDQARQILLTIDHPTAYSWINKIDAIQLPALKSIPEANFPVTKTLPPGKKYRPINPVYIMVMSIIIFLPLAGIAMGLNWRSLGKPTWAGTTIGIFITLILIIGASFAGLLYSISNKNMIGVYATFFTLWITTGINWHMVTTLADQQQKAFKVWQERGDKAMLAYPYDFSPKIIRALLTIALIMGVAYLGYGDRLSLLNSTTGNTNRSAHDPLPQEWFIYTDQNLQFFYHISQYVTSCEPSPDYECLISLDTEGDTGMRLDLVKYPLNDWRTPADIESAKRSAFLANNPNATLGEIYDLTVGGYPARIRDAIKENGACDEHVRQLYIVYGATAYQFTFVRTCRLNDYLRMMDSLITGISFKE